MTTYIDGKAVGVGTIRAEIGVSGVVLHDSTLKGNGNTEPLGVDTEVIATTNQVGNLATTLNTAIDAQSKAIKKTREDYIQADNELRQTLNDNTEGLTTLRDNQASLGNRVSNVESKITVQAGAIATKQNKLTAGSGITIDGDVISSTGGGDFLPLSGGTITGKLLIDVGESPTTVGATRALGFTGTVDGAEKTHWFSYMPQYSRLDVQNLNIYNTGNITPHGSGEKNIGSTTNKFNTVYTNKISSAVLETIIIPALSGTMARIEDIQAIGGVGTEGQVLTKTVDGFEWKDATGGGASLPDQTGNYGKFLITNGNTASWSDTLSNLTILATNTFGAPIFSLSAGGQYDWTFYIRQTGLELHYGGYKNNVLKFPTTGGTLALKEDIDAAVGDISTALTAILGE